MVPKDDYSGLCVLKNVLNKFANLPLRILPDIIGVLGSVLNTELGSILREDDRDSAYEISWRRDSCNYSEERTYIPSSAAERHTSAAESGTRQSRAWHR